MPKRGEDIHASASYRPISLLSCLSKVYEHILSIRWNNSITLTTCLFRSNLDFGAGFSTQHQLWRVTELIHAGLGKGVVTGIIFLDVQKAFDKVWHVALIYKLIRMVTRLTLLRPTVQHLRKWHSSRAWRQISKICWRHSRNLLTHKHQHCDWNTPRLFERILLLAKKWRIKVNHRKNVANLFTYKKISHPLIFF